MVRLSTVGFTVVSLSLKESLAMLTRGRFVCHVHCLVHDGAVWSSPCGPHHENFGRNLYQMFVPAYFASQSFVCFELWYSSCFVVKCWFHTFPKRCSHISMWMLIHHNHRDCHVDSFQPACFSSSGSDHFSICEFNSKFSQWCLFHLSQVVFVFPHPPTLFLQGLRFLNHVSFYL